VEEIARSARCKIERAVQVPYAHVDAVTRAEEILDLRIGLADAELRIDLDERDVGHRQIERSRYACTDQLRDERLRTLPCPAELDDPGAVVGIDDGRQRPALPQGLDVAEGRDERQALDHAGEWLCIAHRSIRRSEEHTSELQSRENLVC